MPLGATPANENERSAGRPFADNSAGPAAARICHNTVWEGVLIMMVRLLTGKRRWLATSLVCLVASGALVFADVAIWKRHMDAGDAAQRQGRYVEAARQYSAAIGAARWLGPEQENEHLAGSLNALGLIYHAQGWYAKAEPLLL
jgi:tetratricopeptide (TPR) repeat protein